MSFTSEFKEFAIKGNMMDLAIGVIIGAAFAKIIDSLVKDIIMPIVGIVLGPKGFANSYYPLSEKVSVALESNPSLSLAEARSIGNVIAWGNFVTEVFYFFILALVVFMLVKILNRLRRPIINNIAK